MRQLLYTKESVRASVKRRGALHHKHERVSARKWSVHPVKNVFLKMALKLISRRAEVNILDFDGFTPLHLCVTAYHNEAILKISKMLLSAVADANEQDSLGSTYLLLATNTQLFAMISLLLKPRGGPFHC